MVMTMRDPFLSHGYIVVVTCIILRRNQNGKIEALIIKRSDEETEGPGLWTIPGGKVEREDWGNPRLTSTGRAWTGVLERAMAREILEEVGIKVCKFFVMENIDVVFVRCDGKPTLVFRFWTSCSNKTQVRLGSDSTDDTWVPPNELSNYQFIGNVREDIEAAMRECMVQNFI